MTKNEFWESIDNVLQRYGLFRHPFYRAWMEGKLSRDDLREYAVEYYHHVASFPRYLNEFVRRLPAGELRHQVYQNFCEEEGIGGGKRSHALLWTIFAEEMGADSSAMRSHAPSPKTQQLIDIFFELAEAGSEAEALAAFYAYESQVPVVAAHKAAALRNRYGVTASGCEYFVLHTTEDVRHANIWREQLGKIVDENPDAAPYALVACELAARALWRALDGINSKRMQAVH